MKIMTHEVAQINTENRETARVTQPAAQIFDFLTLKKHLFPLIFVLFLMAACGESDINNGKTILRANISGCSNTSVHDSGSGSM